MAQSRLALFLVLSSLFCGENSLAREIKHLVVNEKIDRVGALQNGGSGEELLVLDEKALVKRALILL